MTPFDTPRYIDTNGIRMALYEQGAGSGKGQSKGQGILKREGNEGDVPGMSHRLPPNLILR